MNLRDRILRAAEFPKYNNMPYEWIEGGLEENTRIRLLILKLYTIIKKQDGALKSAEHWARRRWAVNPENIFATRAEVQALLKELDK